MHDFTKPYPTPELAQSAARHHAWLASYQSPLRVPALLATDGSQLQFDRIDGRHPGPDELPAVADHLGALHAGLHRRELHACPAKPARASDRRTCAAVATAILSHQ